MDPDELRALLTPEGMRLLDGLGEIASTDAAVADQQRGVVEFCMGIVLRGDAAGAGDEQRGHRLVLGRSETSRGRIP